jgi:hypothetical protein
MVLFDLYTLNIQPIDIFSLTDISNFSVVELIDETIILAQNVGAFQDIDIIQDIMDAWETFVKTGRIWAMLIGLFLGYTFRSFLP